MNKKRKWKKALLLPLLCLLVVLPGKEAAAAEEALPPLIQATTLEEDYRIRLRLNLTGTPRVPEADRQEAFEKVLSSCVRIQVEGHYGSGSIYKMTEQEVVIATNRHVLQYWNEDSYVTFMNGASVPGRLLGVSDTADVGFVAVSVQEIGYELIWFLHTVRCMEPGETGALEQGDAYFAVNMSSRGQAPVCCEGVVVEPQIWLDAFQMPMLLGKGEAVPGMSGGGIFDLHGSYLGMVTGGTEEGITAAVPVDAVAAAYEEIEEKK